MKLRQHSNQITGHDCLLTTEDNLFIFKVQDQNELNFYLNSHEELNQFIPEFQGVVDVTITSSENGQFEFEANFAKNPCEKTSFSIKSKQKKIDEEYEKKIHRSIGNPSNYRIIDPANLHGDSGFQSNEFTIAYENGHERLISGVGCNPWVRRVHKLGRHAKHNGNTISYIAMGNLCANLKRPCVLDLKMGKEIYATNNNPKKLQKQIRKNNVTSTATLGFRLSGLQVYQKEVFVCRDKYYGRGLSKDGVEENMKLFFSGDNEQIRVQVIKTVTEKVMQLISIITRLEGYKFFGSSLAIFYEGIESNDIHADVRLVDFAHCLIPSDSDTKKKMEPDNGLLFGLTNFLQILEKLN